MASVLECTSAFFQIYVHCRKSRTRNPSHQRGWRWYWITWICITSWVSITFSTKLSIFRYQIHQFYHYIYRQKFAWRIRNQSDTTADLQNNIHNGIYSKEFQLYLDEEVGKEGLDQVKWWETVGFKKFPHLFKLFVKYAFIPATSSIVESEFSFTGMAISNKRCRIKPKNVNDLMVARNNCVWCDAVNSDIDKTL